MQSRAFTLLAFGTEEKVDKTNNILSSFNAAICNNKCALDGPGVLGYVDDPVKQGLEATLTWLQKTAKPIGGKYIINMAGYSRGALICLRVANQLYAELKRRQKFGVKLLDSEKHEINLENIEVNIFGMDPVAGPGSKGDFDARDIPPIVKNYTCTLQKHERRQEFSPQDLTRLGAVNYQKTRVSLNPMFGEHSTTTFTRENGTNDCALLNWYHLHDFLTEHHSDINPSRYPDLTDWEGRNKEPCPSPKESNKPIDEKVARSSDDKRVDEKNGSGNEEKVIAENEMAKKNKAFVYLRHYTAAKINEERYRDEGRAWHWSHLLVKKHRSFTHHLEDYVADPDFFINQFHRDAFKTYYPKTFQHVFQNRLEILPDAITQELLRQEDHFIEWLQDQALQFKGGVVSLPFHPKYSLDYIKSNCPQYYQYYVSVVESVSDELKMMAQHLPDLFATLSARGICKQDDTFYIPLVPQGKPFIETDPTAAPNAAITLFRETRQILFDYRRMKSMSRFVNELMTYTARDEIERTEYMEEQIKKIMLSVLSEENKKAKLLRFVEAQYRELVEANSSSELRQTFRILLKKYSQVQYREEVTSSYWQAPAVKLGGLLRGIGHVVKFLGQIVSTIFGCIGDFISGMGRILTNLKAFPQVSSFFSFHPAALIIGYPVALFIAAPLKYFVGYPMRVLGYGIKHGSKIFEEIGRKIRSCGKWLVSVSGRFSIKKIKTQDRPADMIMQQQSSRDSKHILDKLDDKSGVSQKQTAHPAGLSRLSNRRYCPRIWRHLQCPAAVSGLYGARVSAIRSLQHRRL